MAICKWCEQEMTDEVACTYAEYSDFHDGETRARLPYGDPAEQFEELGIEPPANCHDCAVPLGGLHHPGCDMERCPRCLGQAMSCECVAVDPDAEPVPDSEGQMIVPSRNIVTSWGTASRGEALARIANKPERN